MLRAFLSDEQGQDSVEYTLLLAFVCLGSAALFLDTGGSIADVWGAADCRSDEAGNAVGPPGQPGHHHHRWHH